MEKKDGKAKRKKDLKLQPDVEMTDKNEEPLKEDAAQKKREQDLQKKVRELARLDYEWKENSAAIFKNRQRPIEDKLSYLQKKNFLKAFKDDKDQEESKS